MVQTDSDWGVRVADWYQIGSGTKPGISGENHGGAVYGIVAKNLIMMGRQKHDLK